MSRTTRVVPALGLAAAVLLTGCVSEGLPQEGGQGAVTAGPGPEDSPGDAAEEPSPGAEATAEPAGDCAAVLASGGSAVPSETDDDSGVAEGGDDESLAAAFEVCESLDEFREAAAQFPDVLDGNSPDTFVVDRCESEPAVQDSELCRAVEVDDGGQFSSEAPTDG
jgi:hypothetical protein